MTRQQLIIKRSFISDKGERINSMKLTKREDGEIQIYINNGKNKHSGYEKFGQYRLTVEDKELLKRFLNEV